MWLIGAIFLCYVGYDSIKNADHDIALEGEKKTKSLGYVQACHASLHKSNKFFIDMY